MPHDGTESDSPTRESSHGNSRSLLLELPSEIRLSIYHWVFGGIEILTRYLKPDGNPHAPAEWFYELDTTPSLLRSCKQIRQEALPVLRKMAILRQSFSSKKSGYSSECGLAARIPCIWRESITTIVLPLGELPWFCLEHFPRLETVRIEDRLCPIKDPTGEDQFDARIVDQVKQRAACTLVCHYPNGWRKAFERFRHMAKLDPIIRTYLLDMTLESSEGWDVRYSVLTYTFESVHKVLFTSVPPESVETCTDGSVYIREYVTNADFGWGSKRRTGHDRAWKVTKL